MMTVIWHVLNSAGEIVRSGVYCDERFYRRETSGTSCYWRERNPFIGDYHPVSNKTLENALESLYQDIPFNPATAHKFDIPL